WTQPRMSLQRRPRKARTERRDNGAGGTRRSRGVPLPVVAEVLPRFAQSVLERRLRLPTELPRRACHVELDVVQLAEPLGTMLNRKRPPDRVAHLRDELEQRRAAAARDVEH